MSYTALYRKFRPDNFADVKGQDHIVTTLTNQIKHNRIGHAYLFCGTRGTGENMHNHLLFLHDIRVPATNNEAERLLKNYKRKQAQAVTFRSFENIAYLCQCMNMLVLMRLEDPANIDDRVSRIFG